MHSSWASYFSNQDAGLSPEESFSTVRSASNFVPNAIHGPDKAFSDSLAIAYLIRAYQFRGHEVADLDPLKLYTYRSMKSPSAEADLDYRNYGFSESDLDRKLNLVDATSGGFTGFLEQLGTVKSVTLREVIERLKTTYCGGLGVEYMHIASREKCNWIRTRVEQPNWMKYTKEKKLHIYERLLFADRFEKFLAFKFNTAKRFGVEGAESFIPGMKSLIDRGSELGVETFVIGMPHRGRLNVLANVLRKPMPLIFKEFQGLHYDLEDHLEQVFSYSGDVKYHLGTSMDRKYPDGRQIHLSLLPNPSHLEAVNPVAIGKARAKQFFSGNREEDKLKHMPVLLHGDAAFAGQGIVYEVMQMAKVPDFAVGGTVHVIINNQIGFTTNPENARSTMYSTDLGKAFDIPIFHCNADDPLAVTTAFEMAVEWRQQYQEDCIVDMVGYRRHGHNELDQPYYTQPVMYDKIKDHPDATVVFEKQMLSTGVVTQAEIDEIKARVQKTLESEFEASIGWPNPKDSDWLSTKWVGFKSPRQMSKIRTTGFNKDRLREIGLRITDIPASFNAHKQVAKILAARRKSIEAGEGIDWGTAESLAFASLLCEGNHVRLTGQDVQRGTFSHRHAVIVDSKTGEEYTPLQNMARVVVSRNVSDASKVDTQAHFTCRNSILSEFAVLGFEHGYSLEDPNQLILWEAQFGDFVNGAQVMIDQFICSGEDKWMRQCGMVMLLPHGYDGQGAEHSSCRVERFLQMVKEDPDEVPPMGELERVQIQHCNMQVVNCTTPANYFHVLRRQIHREFRKPLIVVSPKSLLREKRCTSNLEEFAEGKRFRRVIPEVDEEISGNPSRVRRVIFCTGKVYYDMMSVRTEMNANDVAVVRVEQIAPFPFDKVAKQCALYSNAEVVWVQEEPKNMGAWEYVSRRIQTATRLLNGKEAIPMYIGRKPNAAPATGLGQRAHMAEQQSILAAAFAH